MMFMPNSPSPPSGTTCNFRSDINCKFRRPDSSAGSKTFLLIGVDGAEWVGPGQARSHTCRRGVARRMAVPAGADLLGRAAVDVIIVDHVVGPAGYSSGNVIV